MRPTRMKNPFLYLIFVLAFACTKEMPHFSERPTTKNSIQKDRRALLDSRVSAKDLCSDYRLFQNLIFYLQNDAGKPGEIAKGPCPRDYKEFVLMIQNGQKGLKDLHTNVAFGKGLDAVKKPVVVSCRGDERCAKGVGSSFFVVPTSVRSEFYGMIFSSTGEAVPLILENVNGKSIESFRSDMDQNLLYSHSKAAWSQYLPAYIFEREVATDRSLDHLNLAAKTLDEDRPVQITLAFDEAQTIFPDAEFVEMIDQLDVGRSYGCKEIMEPSDYTLGACIDPKNQVFVWFHLWPDEETMTQFSRVLAKWIAEKKQGPRTLVLDIRGNVGGSPRAVIDFFCFFGDDETLKIFDDFRLHVRTWPRSFSIAGEEILSAKLQTLDNLSIRSIDPSFAVDDGMKALPREKTVSLSDRTQLSKKSCARKRIPESKNWSWKIVTNGNEFSSSENFLLFAKRSTTKFRSFGRPTLGGSGNPTWIGLPKSNAGVRLSTARDFYGNQTLIEKQGIEPDVEISEIESAEEFRSRFMQAVKTRKSFEPERDMWPKALRAVISAP